MKLFAFSRLWIQQKIDRILSGLTVTDFKNDVKFFYLIVLHLGYLEQ